MQQKRSAPVLPHICHVSHTSEGLLVQFDQGSTVRYQTSLLWDLRDYEGDVPAEIARVLAQPPQLVY